MPASTPYNTTDLPPATCKNPHFFPAKPSHHRREFLLARDLLYIRREVKRMLAGPVSSHPEMNRTRHNNWHLIMPWLLLNLGTIPHGASGGDSSPVPSSPAPPVQYTASANSIAPALFNSSHAEDSQAKPTPARPKDITDALLKAAWEGQTTACHKLGTLWHDHDPVQAAMWYRVAASQGYALSQASLGILYEKYLVAPDAMTLAGEGNLTLPDGRKMHRDETTFFELETILQARLRGARSSGQFALAEKITRQLGNLQDDMSEAIYWYQQAARQGHAAAQYNLGRIYLRLARDNLKRAINIPPPQVHAEGAPEKLYRSTKDTADNPDDQYLLGLLHFHGHGTARNPAEAARIWRLAKDFPPAEHGLAYLENIGSGTPKKTADSLRKYRKLAYFYLKAASDQQVRNAWLDLGHLYLELATDPERQKVFAQQAQQANNGQPAPLVPEKNLDYQFARLWLTKSAQPFKHRITNSPEDHDATGIARQFGVPTRWVDMANPGVDFRRLPNGSSVNIPGSAEAMITLGRMELQGAGAPANPQQSARWFLQAAKMGQPSADFHLAYLYQTGTGLPQNLFLAHQHYLAAARRNHARAQYNLATLYYQAKPVGHRMLFRYTHPPDIPSLRADLERNLPGLASVRMETRTWEGRPFLEVIVQRANADAIRHVLKQSGLTPAAVPLERIRLSFDPAKRLDLWEIPDVLQHVDGSMRRDAIVRYVQAEGSELLEIITPAGFIAPSVTELKKAFPEKKLRLFGHIEMLGDPLWDTYANAKVQRGVGNRLAYQWWRTAEMNGLPEARDRRMYLERHVHGNARLRADNAAERQRFTTVKQDIAASPRLTRVIEHAEAKTWAAGYVVSADGYIVTSSDLLRDQPKSIRIKTESGAVFAARVVESNRTMNGFALLKVDGHRFHPLPFDPEGHVHEHDPAFVLGFKQFDKAKPEPVACSILTHIASTQGNQADPRFLTLSDAVLGDRLYLQFNKFLNPAGTANKDPVVFDSSNVLHGRHPVIVQSLRAIREKLIEKNENLVHAPQFGYLLSRPQWYSVNSGRWHFTKPAGRSTYHGQGEFIYLDGSEIRTPPLAEGVEGRRQILRLLAPSGLADVGGKALRAAFWQAGFERQSTQPGLRGAALLNEYGQAIAIHYPPLTPAETHDYPNFNTYDRHMLKSDALMRFLRTFPDVKLEERRPSTPEYVVSFALANAHGPHARLPGLQAYRPDGWLPPSAHLNHHPHPPAEGAMQKNLGGCNLTLECVKSPMISRARASLVLVQIIE